MVKTKTIHPTLDFIPAEISSAADYENMAPNFIEHDRLAYISGGSDRDITLSKNRQSFDQYSVIPQTFSELSHAQTLLLLLNKQLKHPIFLAPVAHQALVNNTAEKGSAAAAAATDSCMIASTLSSYSMEDIAVHAGEDYWFQLYCQPNERDTLTLIERAVSAGYQAIVVTTDAAIQQPSKRALRAGFEFPKTLISANMAEFSRYEVQTTDSINSPVFHNYITNTPSIEQLKSIISASPLPVLIKGVLNPLDAVVLKNIGAAAIVVSNHGGRTMDGVPDSFSMLPIIRKAVGKDYPVLIDSGIRSGSDIFKAIAMGADAVLIGRLQVYALAVAGALGVAHMIKLLREELELCMAISGCASLQDITAEKLFRNVEG